ncbi:hypothetical protein BRYFOR_05484 [Marvinbryantia formatexigens DSM 14469]|uniref:Uncharacterized protein n=1 Tax=Marvinbryantia formatexigens DSM 14469 TaxID=478749 RepID=C6LA42_9FIRM|nr:hypothetical protein BRYFOR_05484 [Marvinbryantia formatexigens DSM 14469]
MGSELSFLRENSSLLFLFLFYGEKDSRIMWRDSYHLLSLLRLV